MQRRRLAASVLRFTAAGDKVQILGDWLADNTRRVDRCRRVLRDLADKGEVDLSMLSVALHEVGILTRTGG